MELRKKVNNVFHMMSDGTLKGYCKKKTIINKAKRQSIEPKKIVCDNFVGKGFGGEARFIAEKLIKIDPTLDIVWLYDDKKCKAEDFPSFIRPINIKSRDAIKECCTARLWISNYRSEILNDCKKRKGQYYVQTWHGGVCIKAVEKDAGDHLPETYVEMAKRDSAMADLFLSECEWRTRNYREAFWYNGEILKRGLPSSDVFRGAHPDILDKVRKKYRLSPDVHIALYAPTFRNNDDLSVYQLDANILNAALCERFGGEWCTIFRLHPNAAELQKKIPFGDNVLNGTDYPEMNELLISSDVLITDYSGCIFGALYAGKKVFLFATDFQEYVSKERKLYFDIKKLPSPFAENNEQLASRIRAFDNDEYEEQRRNYIDMLGYYEVEDSSTEVAETIYKRFLS